MTETKETVKNMEYLVKLLHKEWGRSGRTMARVPMDAGRLKTAGAGIAGEIRNRHKQLKTGGGTFKQCMRLSRENFILLRLARKVKKAGDKAERMDKDMFLMVEMDREEYMLFSAIKKVREE